MSTFSWVYKQYTFSDPLPPLPSVQTNIFGFQNMGFMHNIYCATTKINPYFKPVWYLTSDSRIGLAKYYDLQISVNIVYFQI